MSKIFTILIAPVRAPYMREKQRTENTVCKKYVNGKVEYHEFRWNNPKAGRNIMWKDTPESKAEREPHAEKFAQKNYKKWKKVYDKVQMRKHLDNDGF